MSSTKDQKTIVW